MMSHSLYLLISLMTLTGYKHHTSRLCHDHCLADRLAAVGDAFSTLKLVAVETCTHLSNYILRILIAGLSLVRMR